jgi:opacity protein-like surface antigen
MKNIKNYIVAAILSLILPLLVFGDDSGIGSKVFSIGPRASYFTSADAAAGSGQWSGGAQARLHMDSLALEGSIDYRSNTFDNKLTTVKSYPVQVSILAYLMPGAGWSPFLLGGAGWYYTEVDGPNNYSNTTNLFGLHAGAGVEIMLNSSLSFDATYRYIWLESVTSRNAALADKNFQDSGAMVTIALNFLF